VPDRGHSAKKRNKPPRRTFLLPSLISLHPPSARRRRLAAAPSGRPSPRPRLATAVPAARRAHPLTRVSCSPSPPPCSPCLPCPRPPCSPCSPCPQPCPPCPSPAPAALAVPALASSCPSPPPPDHAYHRRPHARYTLFMRQFTM
jgi:hypothetical protein